MSDYDDAVGNMDLKVYLRVMMGGQIYEELINRLNTLRGRNNLSELIFLVVWFVVVGFISWG